MAADRAATPGAPSAPTLKKRKRDEGNEEGEEEALVAPAEVRELLAARTSLQPGSAAHGLAQVLPLLQSPPSLRFKFSYTSSRFSSAQPQPCAEC